MAKTKAKEDGAEEVDLCQTLLDMLLGQLTLRSLSDQIYPDWTALVLAETEEAAAAMATIITAQLPALCERFEIVSPADADRWQAPLADAGVSTDPRFVGILGAGDPCVSQTCRRA